MCYPPKNFQYCSLLTAPKVYAGCLGHEVSWGLPSLFDTDLYPSKVTFMAADRTISRTAAGSPSCLSTGSTRANCYSAVHWLHRRIFQNYRPCDYSTENLLYHFTHSLLNLAYCTFAWITKTNSTTTQQHASALGAHQRQLNELQTDRFAQHSFCYCWHPS